MIAAFLLVPALTAPPVASRHPAASSPPAERAPVLAIRADKIWLGDGRSIDKGVILIEGNAIRAVGTDVEIPAGVTVREHVGVAAAGMIAMHGYSGAPDSLRDTTRPVMADMDLALVFDPRHEDFSRALAAGITSLVLTPPPQSLVGGVSALVKTAGGKVVRREAQLSLGFSSQMLTQNKFPTSYAGALAELERLFAEPEGAIASAVAGKLPVLFETSSRQDVQRAIEFAARHDLSGAINGADWAGELATSIKKADLAVVCGPLDVGAQKRGLDAVRALAAANVPFGFGLDAPWKDPAALRFTAALCVRGGLPADAAWRALTIGAAQILGAGDRIGRLDRGCDADIVLWSGDPLDLGSRVIAVYVDGVCSYGAEK
jgi:imidazolonepropionase-like amidohydrolase